ncbi:MAG: Ig-like domain repeat protein [Chloroflexota bacterium]
MRQIRFPVVVLAAVLSATILGVAPAGARPVALAADGPVAEWTFDDGAGTTATDAIGGLDGVITGGATWITGDVAQGTGALQFDGVDDLVTVANDALLEPSGAFTVGLWMKAPPPAAGTRATVLAKGNFGCDGGGSWGIDAGYMRPEAYVRLASWIGGAYPLAMNGPGYNWYTDTWHLLTVTVDPGAASSTISVDGHLWTSSWPGAYSVEYAGPDLVDSALRFGGLGVDCVSPEPYRGAIDDVRIWDRALSRDEILSMLPSIPTTTDLHLCLAGSCTEAPSITSAYVDQEVTYGVHVSPWPASPGDITWYRSQAGGPEVAFATTPLGIEISPGYAHLNQEPGTLEPGSYTIRASWPGADNWQASTSAALPLEITRRPVTMEASVNPSSVLPGEGSTVTARISVADPPDTYVVTGSVDVYETTGGSDQLVGSGALVYTGSPHWNTASITLPAIAAGPHTYEARFAGTPSLAPAAATVGLTAGPQPSSAYLSFTPNPVMHTQHATAVISLATTREDGPPDDLPAPSGTLTVKAYPSGAVVVATPVTGNGVHEVALPTYPIGAHQFTVEYSGDDNFRSSISEVATLTVVSDIVEATGVGVGYPTFYPYRDGYRDTVAIRGTRQEPASVSIRVYSPTGKLVKSVSIARVAGAYSYGWTGRNSSGTILAAGKYRVVQTLTDAAGIRKVVTSYTTLSKKRLYTYTKTLTKDYTRVSKRTSTWVAWSFTLPSATVYKKLVFSIYGKDNFGGGGFGPHDFAYCGSSYWHPDCVSRARTFPSSFSWKAVAGSTTYDRAGRTVRLYAWGGYGDTRIRYGRVKVTYAILK